MGLSGTWRTTMSGGAGSPGRGPGRRAWRTFRFFTRSFISLTCRASASTARSTAAARSPGVSSLRKVWRLAMRVRAAVRRCFSFESTAFASMMGSSGSSLESFSVRASLYVLEMVMPRVLTMSCTCLPLLRLEPSLVRRQHAQLLAVLRDGAPRDRQPLRVQGLGDLLVGQRGAGILGVHHVADHLLHRHRRHHRAVLGGDTAVEEELQHEQPLARLDD